MFYRGNEGETFFGELTDDMLQILEQTASLLAEQHYTFTILSEMKAT